MDWEGAVFYNQEGVEYLIVPVTTNLKKYGKDYETAKSIVFYKEEGDKIKMNIIEVLSEKGTSLRGKANEVMATAFFNRIKNKKEQVAVINANIFFYDEAYNSISNNEFKNGVLGLSAKHLQNRKNDKIGNAVTSSTVNSVGEGCQTWNVYLEHRDEFGTLVYSEFLFSYEVGNCGGDPNEEELPEGEIGGGGDDGVINGMTDPCKNAALTAISAIGINNTISQFYNAVSSSGSPITIVFTESDNISSGGPAQTTSMGNNIYHTTLNNGTAYSSANMSQEAWGAILAHEILHVFIDGGGFANVSYNNFPHHLIIFTNLINTTSNLLHSAFGLDNAIATQLALNGLADLWTLGNFDSLSLSQYGYTLAQVQLTFSQYSIGGLGIRCN